MGQYAIDVRKQSKSVEQQIYNAWSGFRNSELLWELSSEGNDCATEDTADRLNAIVPKLPGQKGMDLPICAVNINGTLGDCVPSQSRSD